MNGDSILLDRQRGRMLLWRAFRVSANKSAAAKPAGHRLSGGEAAARRHWPCVVRGGPQAAVCCCWLDEATKQLDLASDSRNWKGAFEGIWTVHALIVGQATTRKFCRRIRKN